jgi:hypothetical protein
MIAALFVETNGVYFNLPDIDPWDQSRDARLYNGPYPVIAHPPCQLWGKMARVNFARWGGEHNRPGNDNGCFKSALASVEKWGGVLEHPSQTYAWKDFGLRKPQKNKWIKDHDNIGWVCEVWQSVYGHRANKSTWLYYVGEHYPFDLKWERPIGKYQIGFQDRRGKAKNKLTLSKKDANSTPIMFRDELIKLVKNSNN